MNALTILRSPLSISGTEKPTSRPSVSVSNGNNLITNFRLSKYTPMYHVKLGVGRLSSRKRKSLVVRAASKSSDSFDPPAPIAPLQLESPVGQFLSQILVSHPHLVPAAVEQQLEQLQNDYEEENHKEEPSGSGTDIVLYRRIAEVKANERRKALEEMLYTLVVQKFMDKKISLIPSISADATGRVDVWPSLDEKLEGVHSSEAFEMIQNHLALILGDRSGDTSSVAQISKLRVGQVYAASVMFGYFLRRIDQRFQLEKAMKILPDQMGVKENEDEGQAPATLPMAYEDSTSFHQDKEQSSHPEVSPWAGGELGHGIKPSRLRSYVMAFDAETLARYATIRSKEAVSIIEKHSEALFGKPEIVFTSQGTIDPLREEHIKIGFGGLKRLVLEAVTFGSFLWDVESYVDSRIHFVLN